MDWNKSNTILIAAFIILNIFLLFATFSDTFTDDTNVVANDEFRNDVEELLKKKNINIKCEVPDATYVLPVLETEFEIIKINNELLEKYLGKGVEAQDEVFKYNNNKNEILEIIDNKKLIYTMRSKAPGEVRIDESVNKAVDEFLKSKIIDKKGMTESYKHVSNEGLTVTYTEKFNDYNIDNSYMRFFIDSNGIYKFEMQRASSIVEIKDKTRLIPALEALPRIITYDDLKDKDITEIKVAYCSKEDGNWQNIFRTNSDPTWKVIFSDGTQKNLVSAD